MRLAPHEFIRRFLLHVLPDGFHRIRHYGFLARGERGRDCIRDLLHVHLSDKDAQAPKPASRMDASHDTCTLCPDCGGVMRRLPHLAVSPTGGFRCDTS